MGKLTEIANKHNCDKGTQAYEQHGYTEVYDKYIPSQGEFVLLEIGVWKGDSLRMWKEYNPQLIIHGIDISPLCSDCENVHVGSQSDVKFLTQVCDEIGPIDFIIDDGSHRYSDIITSFFHLHPRLKSGGWYFIEDLHASHADRKRVIEEIEDNGFEMILECNDKLLIIRKK